MNKYDKQYYQEVYTQYLNTTSKKIDKISSFWMYNIFSHNNIGIENKKILDYGCGPGHLTVSIGADCYDVSKFILNTLKDNGRSVIYNINEVPHNSFDYVLASHSLEHALQPDLELNSIKRILKNDGMLFLILPIEKIPGNFPVDPDVHQHLYAWNFQSIINLLNHIGYGIVLQDIIYGPTGLNYFNNMKIIRKLGRLKRHNPSLFVIAKKQF